MFLGGPILTMFIGFLWLPVVSILGASFAWLGRRSMSRWGSRALVPVWASAAGSCAGIMLTILDPRRSGWQVHSTRATDALIFAAVTGVLGLVLAPELLVLHLSPRDQEVRAPKLLSQGAALAAGTWIVLVTLTLVGQIVASKP
jgi:hypothetical protein